MILGFVWLSDYFASLGIGWGWSKMASLTRLAVGVGCWLGLSAKGHGSLPCGLLHVTTQTSSQQLHCINSAIFYWSNQIKGPIQIEMKGNKHYLLMRERQIYITRQNSGVEDIVLATGDLIDWLCFNLLACNLLIWIAASIPRNVHPLVTHKNIICPTKSFEYSIKFQVGRKKFELQIYHVTAMSLGLIT